MAAIDSTSSIAATTPQSSWQASPAVVPGSLFHMPSATWTFATASTSTSSNGQSSGTACDTSLPQLAAGASGRTAGGCPDSTLCSTSGLGDAHSSIDVVPHPQRTQSVAVQTPVAQQLPSASSIAENQQATAATWTYCQPYCIGTAVSLVDLEGAGTVAGHVTTYSTIRGYSSQLNDPLITPWLLPSPAVSGYSTYSQLPSTAAPNSQQPTPNNTIQAHYCPWSTAGVTQSTADLSAGLQECQVPMNPIPQIGLAVPGTVTTTPASPTGCQNTSSSITQPGPAAPGTARNLPDPIVAYLTGFHHCAARHTVAYATAADPNKAGPTWAHYTAAHPTASVSGPGCSNSVAAATSDTATSIDSAGTATGQPINWPWCPTTGSHAASSNGPTLVHAVSQAPNIPAHPSGETPAAAATTFSYAEQPMGVPGTVDPQLFHLALCLHLPPYTPQPTVCAAAQERQAVGSCSSHGELQDVSCSDRWRQTRTTTDSLSAQYSSSCSSSVVAAVSAAQQQQQQQQHQQHPDRFQMQQCGNSCSSSAASAASADSIQEHQQPDNLSQQQQQQQQRLAELLQPGTPCFAVQPPTTSQEQRVQHVQQQSCSTAITQEKHKTQVNSCLQIKRTQMKKSSSSSRRVHKQQAADRLAHRAVPVAWERVGFLRKTATKCYRSRRCAELRAGVCRKPLTRKHRLSRIVAAADLEVQLMGAGDLAAAAAATVKVSNSSSSTGSNSISTSSVLAAEAVPGGCSAGATSGGVTCGVTTIPYNTTYALEGHPLGANTVAHITETTAGSSISGVASSSVPAGCSVFSTSVEEESHLAAGGARIDSSISSVASSRIPAAEAASRGCSVYGTLAGSACGVAAADGCVVQQGDSTALAAIAGGPGKYTASVGRGLDQQAAANVAAAGMHNTAQQVVASSSIAVATAGVAAGPLASLVSVTHLLGQQLQGTLGWVVTTLWMLPRLCQTPTNQYLQQQEQQQSAAGMLSPVDSASGPSGPAAVPSKTAGSVHAISTAPSSCSSGATQSSSAAAAGANALSGVKTLESHPLYRSANISPRVRVSTGQGPTIAAAAAVSEPPTPQKPVHWGLLPTQGTAAEVAVASLMLKRNRSKTRKKASKSYIQNLEARLLLNEGGPRSVLAPVAGDVVDLLGFNYLSAFDAGA